MTVARRGLPLVLSAGLALTACHGDGEPGTTPTDPSTTTTTRDPGATTTETRRPKPAIARLEDILEGEAFADGQAVGEGDDIAAGATLEIRPGALQFSFVAGTALELCTLGDGSKASVRLVPSQNVLMRYETGRTLCLTGSDGKAATLADGAGDTLETSGAVWTVLVEGASVLIQVAQGTVAVTPAGGKPAKLVETGEQLALPQMQVAAYQLSDVPQPQRPQLQMLLERREAALPKLNPSFPDAVGSPLLEALADPPPGGRALRVAVAAPAGSPSAAFARDVLGQQLRDRWDVEVDVELVGGSTGSPPAADVVVEPGSASPPASLALFTDAQGQPWRARVPGDRVFAERLDDFVQVLAEGTCGDQPRYATVARRGCYETAYRRAFAVPRRAAIPPPVTRASR